MCFWVGLLLPQLYGWFRMMETTPAVLIPMGVLCIGFFVEGFLNGIGVGAAWEEHRVVKWQRERNSAPF